MFPTPEEQLMTAQQINNQHADLTVPVFEEDPNSGLGVVTHQPYPNNEDRRRPIPISTIDWRSTDNHQFIADRGIDFLNNAEQLYVQQTVELMDLLNRDSENRYVIKIPQGETLYRGCEESTSNQRLFCGSNRAFNLRLYDQTQQEAILFKRRFACGFCSVWCYLQQMEVWVPPGILLGTIKQEFNFSAPMFQIKNEHGSVLFRVEGPAMIGCFIIGKTSHFKIYSADGLTQLGSINHQWDSVLASYNLVLQFPSRNSDTKHKALLLGAAFLLEYMYFVNTKKSGNCKCC